jgi:hypothetical protein
VVGLHVRELIEKHLPTRPQTVDEDP